MKLLLEIIELIVAGWKGRGITPKVPNFSAADSPVTTEQDQSGVSDFDATEYGPVAAYVRALRNLGYDVFDNNEKDFNLNIVGVRDTNATLDKFSCWIAVFWKQPNGVWKLIEWRATTFPGSRYLIERLLNPKGAAILKKGQWGVYKLDTHNGSYKALCQRRGPVSVYRDGDRDREFDLNPTTTMNGMYGINIHAPVTPGLGATNYVAQRVYNASAGCQVFQKVEDFLEFRALCEKAEANWGNAFTYTLIDDIDLHSADVDILLAVPPAGSFDELEKWTPENEFHTAGVRNKNLLNVKGSGWKYSLGTDSRGHQKFSSYAKGLRAGIITLRSYWTRHKKRSITEILSRWAPAFDTIGSLPGAPKNSPREYSLFVAGRMDWDPNAELNTFNDDGSIKNAEQLYQLVRAMAAYENESNLDLPREVFDQALHLI